MVKKFSHCYVQKTKNGFTKDTPLTKSMPEINLKVYVLRGSAEIWYLRFEACLAGPSGTE